MSAILEKLADFILNDSSYIFILLFGILAGVWLRRHDLKEYIDILRNWIDDMRTKDSAQVAEIVRLNKEIAKLRTTLEDVQARLVDEGPAIGEGNSDSGRGPVSPETGDPFRGIERRIEAVLEPEGPPVHEEEGWGAMTPRLLAVGISEQDIGRIREAMRKREIGLVDTRGRERLRFLVRGNQRIPVAILNRGQQHHRVLFPDGKDGKVRVDDLNIIP